MSALPDRESRPPSDIDSERALLGAILRDNRSLNDVTELLSCDDFHTYAHQLIFAAMRDLISAGKPADWITLTDTLKSRRQDEECRVPGYLTELWDEMHLPYKIKHHAGIVRRLSVQRRMIDAANTIARLANAPGIEPDELIDAAERAVFGIASTLSTGTVTPQPEAVNAFLADLDQRTGRGDGECRGAPISTGWQTLDHVTGGLFGSELTVIGARPSVGKTMMGVCVARAVAGAGHGVFVASLEQTVPELVCRLFAAEAAVESQRFRHGDLTDHQRERVVNSIDVLRDLPIWYDDGGSQTILRIAANARRLKAKHDIKVILIDYLQLVQPSGKRDSRRTEEVGLMARQMKQLAKELGVSVIALAQLNREVENRTDNRPRLSDLRDSGEIEQHADNAWLLYAPNGTDSADVLLEIIVAKCRNGPKGTVLMVHDKAHFALRPAIMEGGYI